jgi:hypothetical protein
MVSAGRPSAAPTDLAHDGTRDARLPRFVQNIAFRLGIRSLAPEAADAEDRVRRPLV